MEKRLEQLKGHLIVSCQALPHEPLHSSFIMGRMAKAAAEGGALGIRANTREDIEEIKKNVDLPVIGIVKRDYPDSKVYITPTMREVDELMDPGSPVANALPSPRPPRRGRKSGAPSRSNRAGPSARLSTPGHAPAPSWRR